MMRTELARCGEQPSSELPRETAIRMFVPDRLDRQINRTFVERFLFSGGGGLEVRRDGPRPDLSLDIHGGLRGRHSVDHIPSAESLRHDEADRHQVQ